MTYRCYVEKNQPTFCLAHHVDLTQCAEVVELTLAGTIKIHEERLNGLNATIDRLTDTLATVTKERDRLLARLHAAEAVCEAAGDLCYETDEGTRGSLRSPVEIEQIVERMKQTLTTWRAAKE